MAADLSSFLASAAEWGDAGATVGGTTAVSAVTETYRLAEGESAAEGENQQDLVAFAKGLTQAGVKYFGTAWCTHCTSQKELFEDGADYLPFIEVTNPDRTLNQAGIDNSISSFPTWVFPDNTRLTGQQTLATISQRSGVAIPTSSTPSMADIADVTLLGGSPLHIPLNGYDPNGDPLTYTITSDNPLVTPTLITGNRSLRIDVKDYGKMVFQLFEQRAGRPTERVIELAEDEFYDGVIFHRVIENFVIQGGDPTGTGSGNSTLGYFDDQFHVDLQHNRNGLLSSAKSSDDTNDSQFFVTLGAARHLDFNHSIFGVMVEGYHQLDAIGDVPTNASDRPTIDVVMNSVDVFTDTENGVVMLKAAEGASGTANVKVRVADPAGNFAEQTFAVTVKPDTTVNGGANGGPFLADIGTRTTLRNTPITIPLSAIDVEGDAVYYDASKTGTVNYTFTVDHTTGQLTVTPPSGFVGPMTILAAVRALNGSNTSDTFDRQSITINVVPETPALDLLAVSDSNVDNDNITNVTNMQFRVSNVTSGATVQIVRGTTVIGQGTATGTTIDIVTNNLATLGNGQYTLRAVQRLSGVDSAFSPDLVVTLDTAAPPAFTSTPPTSATNGQLVSYNAQNPEEGTAGFRYSLVGAPAGAAIDAVTGQFSWTPTAQQGGANAFQIRAADAAGNAVNQPVAINVTVVTQLVRIRLDVTDLDGDAITTINTGQDFLLSGYVKDLRTSGQGVFAAYLDVLYAASLVTAVDQVVADISFGDNYQNGKSGSLATDGLIDEVGAFGPTSPLGDTERLLFTVRLRADAAGTVDFTGRTAEGIGHEVLLFGTNDPVAVNAVTYVPDTLTIGAGLVAVNDVFNFDEDTSNNSLTVLNNDTNAGSGAINITAVGTPSAGGTVTISTDKQRLIYTPVAHFTGEDTFSYTISSGGSTSTAQVRVQLAPVNDPPTAVADTFTVRQGETQKVLAVLSNDTNTPDTGETNRVVSVGTASQGGTVTIAPNGTHLLYTPRSGFTGTDTFTYTIRDRQTTDATGLTSQATVTVTVLTANSPTAAADRATVDEDSSQNAINVLANDTPFTAGAALRVTAVTQPTGGGTVTIVDDGARVRYTPAPNFFGSATFTYTVSETGGGTAQGTATVTVTGKNDAPTAVNDTLNARKDGGLQELNVLANDTITPDTNETLTITAVSTGSQGGTLAISSNGQRINYTPKAGFQGTETFTYTVRDRAASDTTGLTSQATVTVQVVNYTLRSIAGETMFSYEQSLGGVMMKLVGTDDFGTAVNQSLRTDRAGSFRFTNLAPGTYKLQSEALPFLVSQATETTIESDPEDGNSESHELAVPGRQAKYFTLADFLASAPRQSSLSPSNSLLASLQPGVAQAWFTVEAGWAGYTQSVLTLSTDSTQIKVRTTNSSGAVLEGNVPVSDVRHVKRIAQDGNKWLVRIDGSPSELKLSPVTAAAAAGAEAEADTVASNSAAPVAAAPAEAIASAVTAVEDAPNAAGEPGSAATFAAPSAEPSGLSSLAIDAPAEVAVVSAEIETPALVASLPEGLLASSVTYADSRLEYADPHDSADAEDFSATAAEDAVDAVMAAVAEADETLAIEIDLADEQAAETDDLVDQLLADMAWAVEV